MPFEPGNSVGVQFSADNQPLSNGRPPGVKNRATIARKVLDMLITIPDETFTTLQANFPDIAHQVTIEEYITMQQAVIATKETNAYKAIMDSAYGAPKVEVKNTVVNAQLFPLDPLSDVDDSTTIDGPSEDSGVTETN